MGKSWSKIFVEDKIWIYHSEDGRLWFHWGNTTWSFEGYLGKRAQSTRASLTLGGEENDVSFSLGIKRLFTFYAGVEALLPREWTFKLLGYGGRDYGVSLFDEYFQVEFHRNEMGMGLDKGWMGINWMFNWHDALFGRSTYNQEGLYEEEVEVDLPEGKYRARASVSKATWTWKRFKKPQELVRIEITPRIPIPTPGKGENGWDQEDDALFQFTTVADYPEQAAKNAAESVMKTRTNRFYNNWVPVRGFHKDVLKTKNESELFKFFHYTRDQLESSQEPQEKELNPWMETSMIKE